MVFRLYFTRIKCLFRDKQNVFWSALFPIFLSFVFSLAFSNLDSEGEFTTIDIAIVEANEQSYILDAAMGAKFSEDVTMFQIQQVNEAEARALLKKGEIVGYIVDGEKPALYIGGSSIEATILKSFVDNYLQTMKKVMLVESTNPEKVQDVINASMKSVDYINDENVAEKSPKGTLIYFYALLALACLYGSNFGIAEISDIQADKSAKGARINVAPVHKLKLLICNIFAAITVQVLCVLVAITFMIYVLSIDFGMRVGLLALTCVLGSICGVTFGAMLRAVIKKNEKTVSAISNATVLLLSFFAGLMNPNIKFIIAENIPFAMKINPASLISDSFYCLYYFDSLEKYWTNILCMLLVTVAFIVITYFVTRRRQYASI
ncbi:ABC transporter permease [Anaerosporobacter sp.]|uniref:ABC transporter permease n=1 Tax=Anaerosporobacter sp. TaxID=1872529 RepID=UPI00286EB952|nr:ABC transporter permease [Anaerosporobacter sp.]